MSASSEARSARVVDLSEWRKNHDLVDQLRSLLHDAEAGKISGLLVAAHYANGDMAYAGSGSLCDCPMLGVAATQQLSKKLLL